MTAALLYVSNNVRRYHTNPVMAALGQTNGDHHGRCVQLLLYFHDCPSLALVRAMATHDCGERGAGDLGAPFKKANPEVAAQHAEVEAGFRRDMLGGLDPLDDVTEQDLRWLALIDRLESYAFMVTHASGERARDGWPLARSQLVAAAWSAGGSTLQAAVTDFIADLELGIW